MPLHLSRSLAAAGAPVDDYARRPANQPHAPQAGSWRRRSRLVAIATVCVLLGACYLVVRRPDIVAGGVDADSPVYLTSALSLAQGLGYRLIAYPAAPPNTFYPPGYPLLLAPLAFALSSFPAGLPVFQAADLLLFAALLGLSAVVLRRCFRAGAEDTLLALLLAATTPLAVLLSTMVMSDTLFGLLALGSALAAQVGWSRGRGQGLALVALGALAATAAYYTRTAGIAVVAALALDGLRRVRHADRARLAASLLPLPLVVPWLAWSATSAGSGYLRHWLQGQPGLAIPLDSAENVVVQVVGNALLGADVLWAVAPALVDDDVLPGAARLAPLALALSALLFGYVVWQSARRCWQRGDVVSLYVLLYLLLTLFVPWRVFGRFLWPVAPILAWYAILGLRAAWTWAAARMRLPPLPLVQCAAAFLVAANVAVIARTVEQSLRTGWPGGPAGLAQLTALHEVRDYLRGLERPTAVLGTNHLSAASWWYLYTGHHTLDGLLRADGQEAFYVPRAQQGDPETIDYFVWQRANGSAVGRGQDDLALLQAALVARGAPSAPLYCASNGEMCVFAWRRRASAD